MDKNSVRANTSLAEVLIVKGKFAEARGLLESAERSGELDATPSFHLAYCLLRESEDKDRMVAVFSPNTAERMRSSLKRAIHLRPAFVEAYKLLAHIALVNGDQLADAAALLSTAIALRPGDAELQLMLAKTYLRLNKYSDAKAIAESVAAVSSDTAIKKEALDLQRAAGEYLKTSFDLNVVGMSSGAKKILFLKRSWLTDADMKQIETNRDITNLNSVLDRPRPGELQIMGRIEQISCSDGAITYKVSLDGARLSLANQKFEGLRLAVLVEGMHSFKLDCGARFPAYQAVLLYKPAGAGQRAELTSITFVPEHFRLMTSDELASKRTVVVEDDMLRRGRERDSIERPAAISDVARFESIRRALRQPLTGERQTIGRLDRVDCADGSVQITATVDEKQRRFTAPSLSGIAVDWFGITGLSFRLACGAQPGISNVLLTYKEGTGAGVPELTAMEFVPADLPPPGVLLNSGGKGD